MYNYFADLQLFTYFVNGITELYKIIFLYGILYNKILDLPLLVPLVCTDKLEEAGIPYVWHVTLVPLVRPGVCAGP